MDVDVRGFTLLGAVAAALVLVGAAPAITVTGLQKKALHALRTGHVDAATLAAGRQEVARAAYLARTLPSGRREHVQTALAELASFDGRLTQPRAVSLIGTLQANDDYFARHYAPQPQTDITDADGVVYRYFPGRCFEFHPLANMGALNARVSAGDTVGTQRLADALAARGVYQTGGGIAWEYTFPFGGRVPWISGMAQAVAAQAFARAAQLLPDAEAALTKEATAAYRIIPRRLLTTVGGGPWIRLYSFGSLQVLNAQLQAVVSLQAYAATAQDPAAAALAVRMRRAAAAALPRFDTGYWTYYALPYDWSPLDYQRYVVQLLKKLAPTDARFADAATRFAAYEKQPPAFQLAPGALGALRFWVSKPATVSVVTGAGPSRRVSVGGGWHTLSFGEPKRPGTYGVRVTAVDWVGNRASFDALPFVRATAAKAGGSRSAAGTPANPPPPFRVGVALPDVTQAGAAVQAGVRLVRIGIAWPPGATALDAGAAAALQSLPAGLEALVELSANPLPQDDAGRSALAQFAASVVAQVHSLRALVLTPAPTGATGSAYVAALGAIAAAVPGAPVGVAVDGSTDPAGGIAPLAGAAVQLVAFRPAPAAAKGAWTLAELPDLQSAFPNAAVLLDGPPVPSAPLVRTAACTPGLAGVVLDRLDDLARPDVRAAAADAEHGAVVCPGVAASVAASNVGYPSSLGGAVAVSFDCDRDCVYLVTLDRADGKPVVARRGAVAGGRTTSVTLPKAKLAGGTYRVDVRLVARVNPGAVTQYLSPPLAR